MWSRPVYREMVPLEEVIDDVLHWPQYGITHVIYENEVLAPYCKHISLFTVTIAISIICIIRSTFIIWNLERTITAQKAQESALVHTYSPPHPTNANATPSPSTPYQRKTSTIQLLSNAYASQAATDMPFRLSNRTGRLSTPGYQTPFNDTSSPRNFSHLERDAPVSYDTLKRDGMLNADGTPTKKYRSLSPQEGEVA